MQKFGRYTLLEKLTTGGMAEVFRGVATGPGGFSRIVAIKKILPAYADSPEFRRMFTDEATIAARLNHANIAQLYDFDIVDGVPYIAMEFVEGKDLRSVLQKCAASGTPIPYALAVSIILEVAKGLYYVHSRRESSRPLNIVHRDVSPQNIMVSHAGEVKLVDFGIARAVKRQAATQAGTVKGKYAYMSPEQVQGAPVDHRTDIFSLGVVLWEMLTLNRLFAGRSEGETIANLLRVRVRPPHELNPEIPAALSPLVLKALEREREDRYANMITFYEALSRFLFDTGSYPDVERISQFVHTLFPDEMERLAQGEHLTYTTAGEEPASGDDATPAADAPEVAEGTTTVADGPSRTAELVDTRTMRPRGVMTGRPEDTPTVPSRNPFTVQVEPPPGRPRRLTAALLLVAVTALLALFGWQFANRFQTRNAPATAGLDPETAPDDAIPRAEQAPSRAAGRTTAPDGTSAPRPTTPPAGTVHDHAAGVGADDAQDPAEAALEAALALAHGPSLESLQDARKVLTPPAVTADPNQASPPKAAASAAADGAGIREERTIPAGVTLHVEVHPPDALVRVAGRDYRDGRIRLPDHRPGDKVDIVVLKGGYAEATQTVELAPDLRLRYDLVKRAHLKVIADPKDSVVTVDGKEALRGGELGVYVVTAGRGRTLEVRVGRDGYYPQTRQIVLAEKHQKEVFELKPRRAESNLAQQPSYGFVKAYSGGIYADVYEAGRKLGATPGKYRLTVGVHDLEFRNAAYAQPVICRVTVEEGYTSKCVVDLEKQTAQASR